MNSRIKILLTLIAFAASAVAASVYANPAIPLPFQTPFRAEKFETLSFPPRIGNEMFIEEPIVESELSEKLRQIQTLRYLSRSA